MLEQGRIVTWLDRNSEYADDLDAVQELLDGARRWAKQVDEVTGASSALHGATTDSLLIDTTTPGVDRELISRLVCGIIDGSVGVA